MKKKKYCMYDSNGLIGLKLDLFYETLSMQQYARLLHYSYWWTAVRIGS